MSKTKYISRVWIDDHSVYAEPSDGERASYEFSKWPRLNQATDAQRQRFTLTRSGIHWDEIDEDLSFGGMFFDAGLCDAANCEETYEYAAIPYPTDGAPSLTAAE